MYSPREIFHFLTSSKFREIIGTTFYKRHMESDDIMSPFNDAESIIFLEWLIDHNYIIAEFRHDKSTDNESYFISTLGHAFLKNYKQNWIFRIRSHYHYYSILFWIIVASTTGSLLATYLATFF